MFMCEGFVDMSVFGMWFVFFKMMLIKFSFIYGSCKGVL